MSTTYSHENYKVPITTQAKFDAAVAGGSVIEGLPYMIQGVCSEIQYGTSAPTTSTPTSNVGDLYIATISGEVRIFRCKAISGSTYTWVEEVRDIQINGNSKVINGVANINAFTFEEYNASATSYNENTLYYTLD